LESIHSQKKSKVLSQDSFERLLSWLDQDRERAGKRYEEVRNKLIKVFTCRGCPVPEELADQTIDRVANKVRELADVYVGDPLSYFYGVARNVHLEYLRKSATPAVVLPSPDLTHDIEQEYECLEQCMNQLTQDNRKLILEYYRDEKKLKIDHRKELAERLGIALNALRIRTHRIRAVLQECVQNCVNQQVM
jgi:DNA-directed RNA polymerase specialized sigma24 family protein